MELGEPDASGRRRPVEIPGSEFEIECDTVIMSLGTSPNPLISSTTYGLDVNRENASSPTRRTGKTSKKGVYAGGDAVTGAATVILAMGAGKAAGSKDFFLLSAGCLEDDPLNVVCLKHRMRCRTHTDGNFISVDLHDRYMFLVSAIGGVRCQFFHRLAAAHGRTWGTFDHLNDLTAFRTNVKLHFLSSFFEKASADLL